MKKKGTKRQAALGVADDRFKHIQSDPKFSGLSNLDKKVVIEKRFAAALTDEKFSARSRVDKRGRKMKKTTGNDLLDLYEVEDDEEKDKPADDADSSDESDSEGDGQKPLKMDLARGEGNVSSSDDESDEDSDWELAEDMHVEMDLAQLDNDVERVEWASRRLAACNLDWELIKCEDILILFNSFKPAGGRVDKITIYLSDFGKEKLDEEEKYGPRLQLRKPLEDVEDGDDVDPETRAAVRRYQVERLKYYYSVIECDSERTASEIYEHCDGFQFETSGLKMDLRFIPDDMEFQEDRVKESLNADDINIAKYRSKDKLKSGVASTSAKLSWDENDDVRTRKMTDAFSWADDDAVPDDVLADSDSDEGEENAKQRREKLLALLNEPAEENRLEVEWSGDEDQKDVDTVRKADDAEDDDDSVSSDIEAALARREHNDSEDGEEDSDGDKKTDKTSGKKQSYKTYREKMKAKRAEKKRKSREIREAAKVVVEGEEPPPKKKAITPTAVAEAVVADDRFKALFTDSAFAIEHTAKQYKGSSMIEKQVEAKKGQREVAKKETDSDLITKLKGKSEKWTSKQSKKKKL